MLKDFPANFESFPRRFKAPKLKDIFNVFPESFDRLVDQSVSLLLTNYFHFLVPPLSDSGGLHRLCTDQVKLLWTEWPEWLVTLNVFIFSRQIWRLVAQLLRRFFGAADHFVFAVLLSGECVRCEEEIVNGEDVTEPVTHVEHSARMLSSSTGLLTLGVLGPHGDLQWQTFQQETPWRIGKKEKIYSE